MDELLKYLPDFDEMDEVAKKSADAKARLEDAKNQLDNEIARCIQTATLDEKYWINGKAPSMSYCSAVISRVGNTPEDAVLLDEIRKNITKYAELTFKYKKLMDSMESRISVWQTLSANKRKALG